MSKSIANSLEKYTAYLAEHKGNPMQCPKIDKVSLTISVGALDKKEVAKIQEDLTMLAGQKALVTLAKKSVASFKLREGMTVGASVTLRKKKIYEFMDRLVYIALPRVRDFKGLKASSVDNSFNYAFGLRDSTVFPEVSYNTSLSKQVGIGISFSIKNAKNKDDVVKLLKIFDLPVF
jgi:large subunit ribosomal protein L5